MSSSSMPASKDSCADEPLSSLLAMDAFATSGAADAGASAGTFVAIAASLSATCRCFSARRCEICWRRSAAVRPRCALRLGMALCARSFSDLEMWKPIRPHRPLAIRISAIWVARTWGGGQTAVSSARRREKWPQMSPEVHHTFTSLAVSTVTRAGGLPVMTKEATGCAWAGQAPWTFTTSGRGFGGKPTSMPICPSVDTTLAPLGEPGPPMEARESCAMVPRGRLLRFSPRF
mmetsp:Transcript_127482/g.302909  ORF Transcript_127482/g.302909 Transcript_127482/m.302909 type:complete len:233 (+) Transcript_127482:798-1496(+)